MDKKRGDIELNNSKKTVLLNNLVLAKAFSIRLEELVDELASSSILDDDALLKKDANLYTEYDWESFPTLSSSTNFKLLAELRMCADRFRHRKGINPKYYLNVPSIQTSLSNVERVVSIFESIIDFIEDPLDQPNQEEILKRSVEVGTSDKKYETWLKEMEHFQSLSDKSEKFV